MKTSSNLTYFSCLLFILSTNFILLSAQVFPSGPVFDTDGKEVRIENSYYILPANITSNRGGGLILELSNNGSCPYEIVQSPNRPNLTGSPLRFNPISPDAVVRVNIDLNIEFVNGSTSKPCPQSNVWRLDRNVTKPPIYVTTGGVLGNPGRQTLSNWFKIQNYEDAYLIQYCPGPELCGTGPCKLLCGDIGTYIANGRRRLAIFQPTYKVVFKKV